MDRMLIQTFLSSGPAHTDAFPCAFVRPMYRDPTRDIGMRHNRLQIKCYRLRLDLASRSNGTHIRLTLIEWPWLARIHQVSSLDFGSASNTKLYLLLESLFTISSSAAKLSSRSLGRASYFQTSSVHARKRKKHESKNPQARPREHNHRGAWRAPPTANRGAVSRTGSSRCGRHESPWAGRATLLNLLLSRRLLWNEHPRSVAALVVCDPSSLGGVPVDLAGCLHRWMPF